MKSIQKFLSLIFAMLIFASQSGMAFNLHYCKGVLASVSLGEPTEVCDDNLNYSQKKCCAKPKTSHKDCCKDSKIDLKKITTEDVIAKNLNFDLAAFYIPVITSIKPKQQLFVPVKSTIKFYDATYATNAPPLYKLYCQYIIYA